MKKLLSAILGVSLLLATVTVGFAQHSKSGHKHGSGSKKGRKQGGGGNR